MNTSEMTKSPRTSLWRDFATLLRYWVLAAWVRIGKRRALILLGIALAGAGIAVNWSWLAAIGVAPIILALAPCAAMCALGLCMNQMGGKSCSSNGQNAKNSSQPAVFAKPHDEVRPEAISPRPADRHPGGGD